MRFISTLLTLSLVCLAPPRGQANPPDQTEIKEAIAYATEAGKYFDRRKWDKAIARYQMALAIVPNSPNVVWNIALSHAHKGDKEQAVYFFKRFVSMAVKPEKAKQARALIKRLSPAKPTVAAEAVRAPEKQIVVQRTPPIVLARKPTAWSTAGWISLGVGVALVGTGAALDVLGKARYQEVSETDSIDGVKAMTQTAALEKQRQGDRLTMSGLTLIGIGSAAAVAGLVMVLADPGKLAPQASVVPVEGGGFAFTVRGGF